MPESKDPSKKKFEFLSQVIYQGRVWEVLWQQGGQVCIRSTDGGETRVVNASRLRSDIP